MRTARYGFFAAMAAAAGTLLCRSKNAKEVPCMDPKGHLGCRSCSQLNGCGLPRALSVRQHQAAANKVAEASRFGHRGKEPS